MNKILHKVESLSGDLIIVSTELPRFSNLSIQLSHIHSFVSSFSRFLSSSFAHRICTLTYVQIYIVIFIRVTGQKRTFMYTYVFWCVCLLKTLRTIGSMLNVFMYNIMIHVLFFINNLVSDTCARLACFHFTNNSFDLSLFFFLFFVLSSVV